jgi:hypothetical protein
MFLAADAADAMFARSYAASGQAEEYSSHFYQQGLAAVNAGYFEEGRKTLQMAVIYVCVCMYVSYVYMCACMYVCTYVLCDVMWRRAHTHTNTGRSTSRTV